MWTVGSTVRIMFASLARWMFETNWLMFSEERWPEGELFHHCWGVEHGIEWHMPSSCEMFFAIYDPGVTISFKPSRVARYKRWQYWVALVCPLHFVVLINICNSVWEGSRITQQERRFFANCASSLNLQRLTLQDLFHHAFWSGAFLSSTCLFGGDLTILSVLYSWLLGLHYSSTSVQSVERILSILGQDLFSDSLRMKTREICPDQPELPNLIFVLIPPTWVLSTLMYQPMGRAGSL